MADVLAGLGHDSRRDPRYGLIGLTFVPRSLQACAPGPSACPTARCWTAHASQRGTGRRTPAILGLARAAEGPLQRQIGRSSRATWCWRRPRPSRPAGRRVDGLSNWRPTRDGRRLSYAWPWNVIGWPGVNVPAGLTDGLPVGAQLLGPADSEALLISLAAQLEASEAWHDRRPPFMPHHSRPSAESAGCCQTTSTSMVEPWAVPCSVRPCVVAVGSLHFEPCASLGARALHCRYASVLSRHTARPRLRARRSAKRRGGATGLSSGSPRSPLGLEFESPALRRDHCPAATRCSMTAPAGRVRLGRQSTGPVRARCHLPLDDLRYD